MKNLAVKSSSCGSELPVSDSDTSSSASNCRDSTPSWIARDMYPACATSAVSGKLHVASNPLQLQVAQQKSTCYSYYYTSNVTCYFIVTFGISIKLAWLELLTKL